MGIIGVVAAMTIPTLTKSYQKKIIETQIKKAYSEIPAYVNNFYVDVNGSSKPNTLNKDVFIINKGTAGGITPSGTLKTIMDNGWKLPANFDW